MIKEIKIKNMFGISNQQVLSFETKDLKESQIGMKKGIVRSEVSDNLKIMLTPTLIAPNATGKTSVLRAIKVFGNFGSADEIAREIFKEYKFIISMAEKRLNSLTRTIATMKRRMGIAKRTKLDDISEKSWLLYEIGSVFEPITSDMLEISYRKTMMGEGKLADDQYNELINGAKQKLKHVLESSLNRSFNGINLREVKNDPAFFQIKMSNGESTTIEIDNNISFDGDIFNIRDYVEMEKEKIEKFEFFDSQNKNKQMKNILNFFSGSLETEEFMEQMIDTKDKNITNTLPRERKIKNEIEYISDTEIRSLIENGALNSLLSELVEKYNFEFINKILRTVDQNIIHIEYAPNNSMRIVHKNGIISIDLLSFGTLKLLVLMREFARVKDKNGTLLIDEIENGLNLSLVNLFLKVIKHEDFNPNGTQAIITTHTPLIISKTLVDPNNIFMYIEREFQRPRDVKNLISRSEDLYKIFHPKNYFNEMFWEDMTDSKMLFMSPNTINNEEVLEIIEELEV